MELDRKFFYKDVFMSSTGWVRFADIDRNAIAQVQSTSCFQFTQTWMIERHGEYTALEVNLWTRIMIFFAKIFSNETREDCCAIILSIQGKGKTLRILDPSAVKEMVKKTDVISKKIFSENVSDLDKQTFESYFKSLSTKEQEDFLKKNSKNLPKFNECFDTALKDNPKIYSFLIDQFSKFENNTQKLIIKRMQSHGLPRDFKEGGAIDQELLAVVKNNLNQNDLEKVWKQLFPDEKFKLAETSPAAANLLMRQIFTSGENNEDLCKKLNSVFYNLEKKIKNSIAGNFLKLDSTQQLEFLKKIPELLWSEQVLEEAKKLKPEIFHSIFDQLQCPTAFLQRHPEIVANLDNRMLLESLEKTLSPEIITLAKWSKNQRQFLMQQCPILFSAEEQMRAIEKGWISEKQLDPFVRMNEALKNNNEPLIEDCIKKMAALSDRFFQLGYRNLTNKKKILLFQKSPELFKKLQREKQNELLDEVKEEIFANQLQPYLNEAEEDSDEDL